MLRPFELSLPKTLDEALETYERLGTDCKIVAGGTDVFVEMHSGKFEPKQIMSIIAVKELEGIREENDNVVIGPLTTHNEVDKSPLIQTLFPGLCDGCTQVGSLQTRMRGTLGGNICNAVPSGDTLSSLLTLDTKLVLAKKGRTRTVAFGDFFLGAKKTVLEPGELLVSIIIPKPEDNSSSGYIKYGRRKAMDLALLGAAASVTLSDDRKTFKEVRIGLTTSAPVPMSALKAAAYLTEKLISADVIDEAGRLASGEAKSRSSWRCSAEYRHEILKVIVPQAINLALQRIQVNLEEIK